jgi:hypothetical protein
VNCVGEARPVARRSGSPVWKLVKMRCPQGRAARRHGAVVFAYYNRLSPRQKRIYRQSDQVESISLPDPGRLQPLASAVAEALQSENRQRTEAACQKLVAGLTEELGLPPVRVKVLAKRPSRDWGELHGLYEQREGRKRAQLTVWMRTAQRRQVVAFRTFLRTILHELGHHLDYELLGLADSFHTEGFYKRESSLMVQLAGPGRSARPRA